MAAKPRSDGSEPEVATSRATPACLQALRAAAVIGVRFDVELLAAVIGRQSLDCVDLLAEGHRLGLVEPDGGPHRHRFVDVVAHRCVLDQIPASHKVELHAAVADAIGSLYADRLESHVFELAGHWSAAAVGDYRPRAADWVARAAQAALGASRYAEAADLFRRALDLGCGALTSEQTCRSLLGLAHAAYRCSDVFRALAACEEAAQLASAERWPHLQAEAALVVEPTLDPSANLRLRRLCVDAVRALPAEATGMRVRVLARLADASHYLDDRDAARVACVELEAEMSGCIDLPAVAAGLHAQQLDASGPQGLTTRQRLATRLLEIGQALDDRNERAWAHLWRVDLALELGDITLARRELEAAGRSGVDAPDAMLRWQLVRAEAALAQAQARYDEAGLLADEAMRPLAAEGNPLGATIWVGQQTGIRFHTGYEPEFAAHFRPSDGSGSDRFVLPGVHVLCGVVVLAAVGDARSATSLYQSLGPVDRWRFQPHSELFTWAYGIAAATQLGRSDDVARMRRRLDGFRGHHVASGAGCVAYFGPVELWLGIAAGHTGDHDAAVNDLRAAAVACQANGAAGFEVQAQIELACTHARRGGAADMRRARSLAEAALPRAELLGMRPFAQRARRLLGRADSVSMAALTDRERQIADLVAEALSNRAIAQRLHLSERTVANHVQHIFEKLGLANRSEVLVWVRDQSNEH